METSIRWFPAKRQCTFILNSEISLSQIVNLILLAAFSIFNPVIYIYGL